MQAFESCRRHHSIRASASADDIDIYCCRCRNILNTVPDGFWELSASGQSSARLAARRPKSIRSSQEPATATIIQRDLRPERSAAASGATWPPQRLHCSKAITMLIRLTRIKSSGTLHSSTLLAPAQPLPSQIHQSASVQFGHHNASKSEAHLHHLTCIKEPIAFRGSTQSAYANHISRSASLPSTTRLCTATSPPLA